MILCRLELAPDISLAVVAWWKRACSYECHALPLGQTAEGVVSRDLAQRGGFATVSRSTRHIGEQEEWQRHLASLHSPSVLRRSSSWACRYRFYAGHHNLRLGGGQGNGCSAAPPPADLSDVPRRLTVKLLTGRQIVVTVNSNERLARVAELIEEDSGIPPTELRLLVVTNELGCAGAPARQLALDAWVGHCGLEHDSVVHALPSQRRGQSGCPGNTNQSAHDMSAVAPALFWATASAWTQLYAM